MSDSNNNWNLRDFVEHWGEFTDNNDNNSSEIEAINEDNDLLLETGNSSASLAAVNPGAANRVATVGSPVSEWPVGCLPGWLFEAVSPDAILDQVLADGDFDSDPGSEVEMLFDEPPQLHGIRFYNPNYQAPVETEPVLDYAGSDTPSDITVDLPSGSHTVRTINLANSSRLDLRPVPASIDLTRNRPTSNWRQYHARARSTAQMLSPDTNISPLSSAATFGRHRLSAGQPPSARRVPMVMDHELGAFVYLRDDTDSEEDSQASPLVMVPRRGNSISDLSQCSSDEETLWNTKETRL